MGEKYATVLLARLRRDGELEYVNCGHVPPLAGLRRRSDSSSARQRPGGVAVRCHFRQRHLSDEVRAIAFIIVTDGVTEAENAMGDFFEDFRLEAAASKSPTLEGIFGAVTEFCAGNPLSDDCTVVELCYTVEVSAYAR